MVMDLIVTPERDAIAPETGLLLAALARTGKLTFSTGVGPEYLAVTSHQHGGAAGAVYFYRKATGSCALTALDSRAAGQNSYDIQVAADRRTLYVANDGGGAGSLSVFRIDYGSERLSAVQTLTASGPGGNSVPYGMTFHPNGFLYAADGDAASGSVLAYAAASDGTLTALTPEFTAAGTRMWFATLDRTNSYLYASHYDGGTLYRYAVNASTGGLTFLGNFTIGTNPWHVNRHPTLDTLYITNNGSASVSMLAINTADGSTANLGAGSVATGAQPIGLAVGENFAYAAANGGLSITGYRVDRSTGALSQVTSESTGAFTPYGLGMDAAGACLYVGETDGNGTLTAVDRLAVYGIDGTSGALRFVESHEAGIGPRFPILFRRPY